MMFAVIQWSARQMYVRPLSHHPSNIRAPAKSSGPLGDDAEKQTETPADVRAPAKSSPRLNHRPA